jgi:ATP-binding protein involved in chromosome partitioning
MAVTREMVLGALRGVTDPATGRDLVASDLVRALGIAEGEVRFVIEAAPERAAALGPVRAAAEAAVLRLPGVTRATVILTAERPPAAAAPAARPAPAGPAPLSGIDRIVAIASGKGGVGKSTVAANLAVALAALGRRTGLLDADIYGPSQPQMLGIDRRPGSPDGKRITPVVAHGVTVMSIGMMTRPEDALVWRGPMLMGALTQLLTQVDWGPLDILIVDLPPGTGDVQLSLTQKARLSGAIVVSTPQDVALIDARRAITMLEKVKVPVLGLIENMALWVCPNCGHEDHPFGHGGARAEAERRGLPFLGELPLDLATRVASDRGAPVVLTHPEGAPARAFRALAERMIAGGMA